MKFHQPIKLGGKARSMRYLNGSRYHLEPFFLKRCREEYT